MCLVHQVLPTASTRKNFGSRKVRDRAHFGASVFTNKWKKGGGGRARQPFHHVHAFFRQFSLPQFALSPEHDLHCCHCQLAQERSFQSIPVFVVVDSFIDIQNPGINSSKDKMKRNLSKQTQKNSHFPVERCAETHATKPLEFEWLKKSLTNLVTEYFHTVFTRRSVWDWT